MTNEAEKTEIAATLLVTNCFFYRNNSSFYDKI